MFVIQPTFETVFFFFSKIRSFYMLFWGFPDSSVGKESAYNAGNHSLIPGIGKIHWRRDRLPIPVFLGFPGG